MVRWLLSTGKNKGLKDSLLVGDGANQTRLSLGRKSKRMTVDCRPTGSPLGASLWSRCCVLDLRRNSVCERE